MIFTWTVLRWSQQKINILCWKLVVHTRSKIACNFWTSLINFIDICVEHTHSRDTLSLILVWHASVLYAWVFLHKKRFGSRFDPWTCIVYSSPWTKGILSHLLIGCTFCRKALEFLIGCNVCHKALQSLIGCNFCHKALQFVIGYNFCQKTLQFLIGCNVCRKVLQLLIGCNFFRLSNHQARREMYAYIEVFFRAYWGAPCLHILWTRMSVMSCTWLQVWDFFDVISLMTEVWISVMLEDQCAISEADFKILKMNEFLN